MGGLRLNQGSLGLGLGLDQGLPAGLRLDQRSPGLGLDQGSLMVPAAGESTVKLQLYYNI